MTKQVNLKPFPIDCSGCEIAVFRDEFVIGRHDDCDLVLGNRLVSRHHCKLIVAIDGVYVQDLGSRNGTYVNTDRIFGRCELRDDDILGIGISLFQVGIRTTPVRWKPLSWSGLSN